MPNPFMSPRDNSVTLKKRVPKPKPERKNEWQGPLRPALEFYAGEYHMRPDVERHPNGAIAGVRNKVMRRVMRKFLRTRYSRIGVNIALAQRSTLANRSLTTDNHSARRLQVEARTMRRKERDAKRER